MKKDYKVIDCIVFNDELEMLKMRLDYYNDSVDYFVICESTKTQSGHDKELSYGINSSLFNEYKDKIHYVIYNPTESDLEKLKEDKFFLEDEHRECLRNKVRDISDENCLILLSDVDEFPKKELFDDARRLTKDLNMDAFSFKLKTFYYSPITELLIDCYATVAVNDYTMRNVSRFYDLRKYTFNCGHIENGGYHLSFFMTPEKIQRKILTYSHQEFNSPEYTDLEKIKYRMYNGLDIFERSDCPTKKFDTISAEFPIEFYRHEIFFRNTFDRIKLKPWVKKRKDDAMQIPLEIENLQLSVNNHKSKVVVEIGTAAGGTISRWFEIPSVETVITIDYPEGIHGGQGFQERTYVISDILEQANLCKKEFYAINGDSKHPYLINRLDEILNGRKIDFLFIDGDHTYEGVKGDFYLYEKFLNENSIIGFHDIIDSQFHREAGCFVSDFWNELKKQYNEKEFIYTQFLDRKVLPFFYDYGKDRGGFGGIGMIKYNEKKSEKISLVVPIYNNVELAIENINKTIENSKHIDDIVLYSNGTTEEGNQKLIEFSKQNLMVRVFINERPIGFVKAVNEGFKKSKNELIMCLNSDANLFADWEDRLLPLCKIENNGLIGPILQDDFILGCCFIVKKSILNKIGLLNEGFGMGYHDDGEITERVLRNGYELGYSTTAKGWTPESRTINFPMNHIQGVTFIQIDYEKTKIETDWNGKKLQNFRDCTHIKVLKNLQYEDIKPLLNEEDVFLVINKSGENFEKVRYDKDIVKFSHIFECTDEMDINTLINSITKGKTYELIEPSKKKRLTWLAKFDDYASMGILSQRVIEKLSADVSCKPIIGATETNNQLIHELISKPNNTDIGIMFSYPDMIKELNEFKTKVIYTGVDTTGGIPNFAENINNADFILTPSTISKERMEFLGVKKPIFVFPHGIDPEVFKYSERIKSNVFKFLYVGECSDRKGIFQLLDAFIYEFKNNENVELHIKSNNDMLFYGGDKIKQIIGSHKNIYWHTGNEGHDYVLELYKTSHAYVYPSRADTFGMTLLEAMACGLPVISTNEPGATELIKGRYYPIRTDLVPVRNHPWMLGKWGEPNVKDLRLTMRELYDRYDDVALKLKENSDYIIENYSWDKVVGRFEKEILPQLKKKTKVLTLLTSYNRPHHIKNVINSLKDVREDVIINDVYIVENSNNEFKELAIQTIKDNIDDRFTLYVSEFNMGQRGALLQMLEDVNLDDYDFIQFTDQDNIFNEPISTYCDILREHTDIYFATGYMSKEHGELGWRKTRFGNLCEKRSLRAGHMVIRTSYLKSLFPLHLDAHYGQPYNSSWNAGLDWEIQYWNPKSIGKQTEKNFVLCVPGGVLHKGTDSTMYDWDVEGNEYKLEELNNLRY